MSTINYEGFYLNIFIVKKAKINFPKNIAYALTG